ncbi:heat-inducible transcription repressor hrcA [Coprococcus sp. CAG:782]|jgi:heat-inducible transcriptional repressor|nr:heat-inducible transcription repressor hrcA [Coprococcus sp. CAG:782]
MELDERKVKILKAIVANYLETGEPVGSRTISKYTDLNLSSATIRNEMSDLEDMGYICQPHTSAGRIPTDAGYRFYVDSIMEEKQEVETQNGTLLERVDKIEKMLKQVAKVLAANTNYATLVTMPQYGNTVKFIQLSKVNNYRLLAVIMVDGNIVRNKLIDTDYDLKDDEILKFNILLNTFLQGASIQDINLELIQTMKSQAGEYAEILEVIFQGILEAIKEADDLKVYTSGATNMLKYPELINSQSAEKLLGTFEDIEDKEEFVKYVEDAISGEDKDIQIHIGEENQSEELKDCSLITATYKMPEGAKGTIGIIGPKRMDYKKVVTMLKNLTGELDDIFSEKEQEDR